MAKLYPDPVRVVSVGVDVDDILKNVKDSNWEKVSIEFCGGTHVRSTGDIKDLIILEESGIAKGIRRIIAVTGEDAHEAQRVAEEFSGKLDKLEKMPFGAPKEQEAKTTQLELNNLSISAVKKSQFRERFAKISKEVLEQQKKFQKEETKKAVDTVTEYFEKNANASGAVLRLPIGGSAKIVPDVVKHVQTKMKDKSVYVLVADEKDPEGKVYHGCFVGQVSLQPYCTCRGECWLTTSVLEWHKSWLKISGMVVESFDSGWRQSWWKGACCHRHRYGSIQGGRGLESCDGISGEVQAMIAAGRQQLR